MTPPTINQWERGPPPLCGVAISFWGYGAPHKVIRRETFQQCYNQATLDLPDTPIDPDTC